jgi:hypothetical protein
LLSGGRVASPRRPSVGEPAISKNVLVLVVALVVALVLDFALTICKHRLALPAVGFAAKRLDINSPGL